MSDAGGDAAAAEAPTTPSKGDKVSDSYANHSRTLFCFWSPSAHGLATAHLSF
jgi:hypothetical protein